MATLANLTLLIVSFDLEDQAAAIDLDQFSAGPYLLAKRRGCQVAYIHHRANRHISWLQLIGHRSPRGILHERDHHGSSKYFDTSCSYMRGSIFMDNRRCGFARQACFKRHRITLSFAINVIHIYNEDVVVGVTHPVWYDELCNIPRHVTLCNIGSLATYMQQDVQRVAHRGGSHLAPENTLAAFRNALTLPIDALELDVHMSRDGHAVVIHDNTVDKRTNGKGNILDLDFVYLRSLNAAAYFPGGWPEPQQIPTLREVLDLAKGYVQVYIEIKSSKRDGVQGRYPHIAETVVDEVRSAGMLDQVLIISFDWLILPQVKALEPALHTGALVSNDVWNPRAKHALQTLMEQVAALGCEWINMDDDLFTAEMPALLHERGFKLGLWTVNTAKAMLRFAAAGVDSFTSDRPDLFSVLAS